MVSGRNVPDSTSLVPVSIHCRYWRSGIDDGNQTRIPLAICICKRLRVLHNSNMADLTNLFKATVKSIKSRNKTLNKDVGTDIKTNIFPKKKLQGDFEMKSKELVMQTNQLFCSSQSRFRTQHFLDVHLVLSISPCCKIKKDLCFTADVFEVHKTLVDQAKLKLTQLCTSRHSYLLCSCNTIPLL